MSLSSLSRPTVGTITPYEPGKPISEVEREYGLTNVIKLASNENPLGPSPKAVAAIKEALDGIHRYPDGAGYYLKEELSHRLSVPSDWIVLGNGSTELVELVTEAFINPGDEAVIGRYEFFKYRIAMQIMDGGIVWSEMPGLEYDVDDLIAKITPRTKTLWIANPNNPTGTCVTRDQVEHLMRRVPPEVIVVFDEAYYEYRDPTTYPDTIQYVRDGRNVVIFRTFSKAYGLAALRVGYAIAPSCIAQAMNRVREAFNVNSLGQIGALAALDDGDFLAAGIELNRVEKARYYRELDGMGIEFKPSAANFVLVKAGIPGRELFQMLLKRGVVVRPVDGYGLADWVRVSVGLPEENDRFLVELRAAAADPLRSAAI